MSNDEFKGVNHEFPEVGKFYEYILKGKLEKPVYIGELVSKTKNGLHGEAFLLTFHFRDEYNNDTYQNFGQNNPFFLYREVQKKYLPRLEDNSRDKVNELVKNGNISLEKLKDEEKMVILNDFRTEDQKEKDQENGTKKVQENETKINEDEDEDDLYTSRGGKSKSKRKRKSKSKRKSRSRSKRKSRSRSKRKSKSRRKRSKK